MDYSLTQLGLAVVCEACEAEIDLLDDDLGSALCRQCGVAFLVEAPGADVRRLGA